MFSRVLETVIGFIVLAIGSFLLISAYRFQGAQKEGYVLFAQVSEASGLREGANVCVCGVQVGRVDAVTFDKAKYAARIALRIYDKELVLPSDTKMSIESVSLLGGKYVSLTPGVENDRLKPGDSFFFSNGSVSFEKLLIGAFASK